MRFCGSVSALMEGEGGLHCPWPESRLKPKLCFSPRVQFCDIPCRQSHPSLLHQPHHGQQQSHRFDGSCQEGKWGPAGAKFWWALSATDSHDQEETTEMRKGDARAVRMSCMSNIYLFIIQH